jgi:hypothetical protein
MSPDKTVAVPPIAFPKLSRTAYFFVRCQWMKMGQEQLFTSLEILFHFFRGRWKQRLVTIKTFSAE